MSVAIAITEDVGNKNRIFITPDEYRHPSFEYRSVLNHLHSGRQYERHNQNIDRKYSERIPPIAQCGSDEYYSHTSPHQPAYDIGLKDFKRMSQYVTTDPRVQFQLTIPPRYSCPGTMALPKIGHPVYVHPTGVTGYFSAPNPWWHTSGQYSGGVNEGNHLGGHCENQTKKKTRMALKGKKTKRKKKRKLRKVNNSTGKLKIRFVRKRKRKFEKISRKRIKKDQKKAKMSKKKLAKKAKRERKRAKQRRKREKFWRKVTSKALKFNSIMGKKLRYIQSLCSSGLHVICLILGLTQIVLGLFTNQIPNYLLLTSGALTLAFGLGVITVRVARCAEYQHRHASANQERDKWTFYTSELPGVLNNLHSGHR